MLKRSIVVFVVVLGCAFVAFCGGVEVGINRTKLLNYIKYGK